MLPSSAASGRNSRIAPSIRETDRRRAGDDFRTVGDRDRRSALPSAEKRQRAGNERFHFRLLGRRSFSKRGLVRSQNPDLMAAAAQSRREFPHLAPVAPELLRRKKVGDHQDPSRLAGRFHGSPPDRPPVGLQLRLGGRVRRKLHPQCLGLLRKGADARGLLEENAHRRPVALLQGHGGEGYQGVRIVPVQPDRLLQGGKPQRLFVEHAGEVRHDHAGVRVLGPVHEIPKSLAHGLLPGRMPGPVEEGERVREPVNRVVGLDGGESPCGKFGPRGRGFRWDKDRVVEEPLQRRGRRRVVPPKRPAPGNSGVP